MSCTGMGDFPLFSDVGPQPDAPARAYLLFLRPSPRQSAVVRESDGDAGMRGIGAKMISCPISIFVARGSVSSS